MHQLAKPSKVLNQCCIGLRPWLTSMHSTSPDHPIVNIGVNKDDDIQKLSGNTHYNKYYQETTLQNEWDSCLDAT